jgi:hypothetical protein
VGIVPQIIHTNGLLNYKIVALLFLHSCMLGGTSLFLALFCRMKDSSWCDHCVLVSMCVCLCMHVLVQEYFCKD